ncbi:MAG: UDP-2,3-diacylglucosamine diphosphatase [Bacteroidota bacterium]|nr:MAG: UDP-2,3-diacylglucosamine diphosphatase [Bacteroidota bacterium]
MNKTRRKVEIAVISDVHLGTYGCHARELNRYLKSIHPETLILNGDIIDIWQFSKRYWPNPHMKVIKQILNLSAKGTKVYYVTGNHDETLRKFAGLSMGNFHIVNKLELELDGKKAWIFHGDVFDVIMQYSRWLAKLGAISYDALILLNIFINKTSSLFGRGKVSLSKKIKDNVKSAVKYINNFEETAAQLAIQKGFDYIICGHIHHPDDRIVKDNHGKTIRYLNSGDWIENLTALEYKKGKWKIYRYLDDNKLLTNNGGVDEDFSSPADLDNKELFNQMLKEFQN